MVLGTGGGRPHAWAGATKLKDLAVFARQFATMTASGMSLLRSLAILEEQTSAVTLKKALGEIAWAKLEYAIPAFLIVAVMPLTYSIANTFVNYNAPAIGRDIVRNVTGAGAILASIETASGVEAEIMGKPHQPMLRSTEGLAISSLPP
mgnify:CR=1 FL=1